MAIEQNVKVRAEDDTTSVIENELPAYRAVSPSAVFAVILGLMSLLSFASPYFLVFSGLAMLFGYKAERTIKKYPDMYTGRGLAQAGLGLGLIFGLTAVTVATVLGVLRANAAKGFAKELQTVFQKGSPEDVIWYMQNPTRRGETTPDKLVEELRNAGGGKPGAPGPFEAQFGMVKAVKEAIAEPNADIHFVEIERHGDADMTMYAIAVYEIHSPEAKKAADRERYLGTTLKAMKNKNGRYEWWVEDMKFPYKPNSLAVAVDKPVDDGHGHGGGGH